MAYGNWNGDKVRFNWNNPDNENDNSGFREEISRRQRGFKLLFACMKSSRWSSCQSQPVDMKDEGMFFLE